jgi:hypothetical protein
MPRRLLAAALIVVACLGVFYAGIQTILTIAYGFPNATIGYGLAVLASLAIGFAGLRLARHR